MHLCKYLSNYLDAYILVAMEILTVTNLKGGSAKTTSVAYLAHAYAEKGRQVMVVDADPQRSALRWSEAAEWEIPTVSLPVKTLHSRLSGVVPEHTDLVIIDTPPLDEQAGIVYSALRAADTILVTTAPTMGEYERLPDVWAAIEEVQPLRSSPPLIAVLLNRTVARAKSTQVFRDQITQDGHTVLETTIPRREIIAQSFGAPITDPSYYNDAAAELDRLKGHNR